MLDPDAYYTRPIALRNPIVFYEGHLPAFSVIALLKRGLGRLGSTHDGDALRARHRSRQRRAGRAAQRRSTVWPSRGEVLAYGERADDAIVTALQHAAFDLPGGRIARCAEGEGIYTALEHEAMHQETLLYMWHRLPHAQKRAPARSAYERRRATPPSDAEPSPWRPESATLGAATGEDVAFGWDNEFDAHAVDVPGFDIDAHNVTNADFLEFVDDRRLRRPRMVVRAKGGQWRQQEQVTHPAFWLVGAAARWRWLARHVREHPAAAGVAGLCEPGGSGGIRALAGPPAADARPSIIAPPLARPAGAEREFPGAPRAPRAGARQLRLRVVGPVPAGARPAGASAWGVHDLVGNGWEWTSIDVRAVPGLRADGVVSRNTRPSSSTASTS